MKRNALTILALALLLPVAYAGDGDGKADGPKARFYQARRVMLDGDPKAAAELFKTLEADHRGTEIAGDCLYWMGRCYLRFPDREPDAVVAFGRLVREHAESPFVDDACRELAALGDRGVVTVLKKRVAAGGSGAETAKAALAEFGEKKVAKEPAPSGAKKEKPSRDDEIKRLEKEIARLKQEVEEALALVRKLLAEKEKGAAPKPPAGAGKKGEK